MQSQAATLINRHDASVSEKLNAVLNLFSEAALSAIFSQKLGLILDFSPVWKPFIHELTSIVLTDLVDKRDKGHVSNDIFGSTQTLESLELLKNATNNKILFDKIAAYVESLPEGKGKAKATAKEKHHGYVMSILSQMLRQILEDMDVAHLESAFTKPLREGDVLAEGPGFEVVVGAGALNHVRYSDGNTSIIVMHDVKESQFLLVERFNPIKGLFLLEFPRVSGSHNNQRDTALNSQLKEQTGMSFRNLEKIGSVNPESRILDGLSDVYYGNFDLEENHEPSSKHVRSLKRITEDGLYQAADEGRIECGMTLAAISVWHAFESVRKKRVANSRRVRNRVSEDEDED
jgi:hypothetical protein